MVWLASLAVIIFAISIMTDVPVMRRNPIEVAEGQTETIVVHDDDSPEYLAAQFCLKYK